MDRIATVDWKEVAVAMSAEDLKDLERRLKERVWDARNADAADEFVT